MVSIRILPFLKGNLRLLSSYQGTAGVDSFKLSCRCQNLRLYSAIRWNDDENDDNVTRKTLKKNKKVPPRSAFVDSVYIHLTAGTGGQGLPTKGGVGGRGGDIVAVGTKKKETLYDLVKQNPGREFTAPSGSDARFFSIFVNACPASLQSYLKLSRVDRPIGTWLLFWPCTWGLCLGTVGYPDLKLLVLFATGAFIMRGAGCTINDMWDRHIDAKVKRTVDRPLASGQLRMRHAAGWLAFQLSLALSILFQLNNPCFIIGVASLGLVCIYPLAKRVTNWPQAVLGLTFNTGVIMGYTAAANSNLGYITFPWLDPSCISLYFAGVIWTLIYDTIYAHQDREDDAELGLGSTARRFGENTKTWLTGFSGLMISSLVTAGIMADLSWPYYLGTVGVATHLVWQIHTLDIHDAQNCSNRFSANRHIGWIIGLSILGSSLITSKTEKSSSTDTSSNVQSVLNILKAGQESELLTVKNENATSPQVNFVPNS